MKVELNKSARITLRNKKDLRIFQEILVLATDRVSTIKYSLAGRYRIEYLKGLLVETEDMISILEKDLTG